MEMGSTQKVGIIETKGEVYQCPSCGYQDGFHTSFKWDQEGSHGEIYLICPNCHGRFRTGWRVPNPSKEEKSGMTWFDMHSY